MAITTSKYGTLDFSKSPISLNTVGDGTYAVEFGDYLYVPETTINKGVTSGDTQYYFPYFLNQDNLNTFAKNAESISLSSLPYGDVLAKNYGVSESGYLIPKSKSFDTTNASVPAEWGSITGLSVKDGQLVYGTTGRPGDSYGWISSSGVGSQPLPKRSGGLWGFVEDIGSTLVDAGPIVKLAALVSGNPYLYAASAGTDIAKGNYLGAALGLAGASGNIPGVGATTAAAGEAAGAGLAEGAFPGLVEGTVASDAGIAALAPEAAATVTSPVTSGAVAESAIPPVEYAPEVNVGTAAPPVPEYAPEVNVGTAAPPMNEGIAALPVEPPPPTLVPSTPMEPANPQDFGATIENGGVAPSTVANPVGTGDPGSAPLDTTSNLPGDSAGAPGSSYVTTPGGGIADITGAGTAAAAAGTGAGLFQSIADATGIPVGVLNGLAASLGISALGSALQPSAAPSTQGTYTGPLANIRYNPATYTPYTYKPYAGGGAVESMSNANAIGANTGFPMADIQRGAYATPYQQPISQNVVTGDQDTRVDPYTGQERLAGGGITGSGELNLNIPLNFGGGAVGGFGQSPNGIGLNINQGPLDLGQGNNSGFGQANANGYKAAGSGTSFSSSLTGSPNTVGLSQNPFSMLLPGGYNPPAKYSAEQVNPTGMSFEEMVKRQQGLDAQRTTPQIMQERLAEQTIREAKAAEDAKKYTRDFNSFGFDKKLLDYLNNQRLASTYDGGIDYGYDPVTQTFRGGSRMGPVTKTLDEMQAYADKGMASGGLAALAAGGMYNLGGYSDGGRLLRGPGDGVSDSIPAVIGNKQPARLADGEFVIPARIVSELGNGSTEAGARQLYAMMDRIQAARRKTTGKEQVAANTKAAKHLPA